MSIFRLLQVGLPVSGMVGMSVINTGGPSERRTKRRPCLR
jgi:hypothetical protein